MGGGGKGGGSQVVGHKYYMGQHLILGSNPMAILEMKFQDKTAFSGYARGGTSLSINKEDLFGGEAREGGVSGIIDVMDGDGEQPKNNYLMSQLGTVIPAFRHMTSLVFNHFYMGNNYYPKSPSIKATDQHIGASWYSERAHFNRDVYASGAEIYIGLSQVGTEALHNWPNMLAATAAYLRDFKGKGLTNRFRIHQIVSEGTFFTDATCATDEQYEALAVTVEGLVMSTYQTHFYDVTDAMASFYSGSTGVYVEPAPVPTATTDVFGFANTSLVGSRAAATPNQGRRVAILLGSTGNGIAGGISGLAATGASMFCIHMSDLEPDGDMESLDNTPSDGLARPANTDVAAIQNAMRGATPKWVDLNPAHIFRDLIVSTATNGERNPELIGDSFATAADTLYDEGFGLSFYWRSSGDLDDLRRKVEEHVDCSLYFSRKTGKWEIKLIREDYDVNTLPLYNLDNVITWKEDINREVAAELPNKVSMTYRKQEDGEKKAITVSDPASIAVTGTVRPVKVDFEGIFDDALANRVAARELRNRSQAKWSGTIIVHSVPDDLNIGSEFLLQNAEFGITDPIVVRVAEMTFASTKTRSVTIKFIEDKFSLGAEIDLEVETVIPVPQRALEALAPYAEEAPYYAAVQQFGQTAVDANLADDDLQGYAMLGCSRPNSRHIDGILAIDEGAGWSLDSGFAFSPYQSITEDLSDAPEATSVVIDGIDNISGVSIGTLAFIGDEIVRVDALVESPADTYTLTLGRGCLDTTPKAHLSGALIIFVEDYATFSSDSYLASETLDVRFLTRTGIERLALLDANTHTVTFDQRANRPYRCGDLQLNGSRDILPVAPDTITLTWKHRDRTLQTTGVPEDYLADNIGPEAGVTYRVVVTSRTEALAVLNTITTVNVGAVNTYEIVANLEAGRHPDSVYYGFQVIAERDGVDNWEELTVYCSAFVGPSNLALEEI